MLFFSSGIKFLLQLIPIAIVIYPNFKLLLMVFKKKRTKKNKNDYSKFTASDIICKVKKFTKYEQAQFFHNTLLLYFTK